MIAAAGIAASLATTATSVAGAVGGSQKSGGASTSGATSNAPWEPQQPYLKGGFTDAQTMYQNALGQSIQNGFGNQVNGLNSAITGLNAAYTGGSNDQAGDQSRINEGLANYNAQTTAQQNILDRYWKVIGSGLGSSSTTSSTNQPNNGGLGGALSGAIGGGLAGYGAYKNLTGNTDPFGFRTAADNSAQSSDPWADGTNWSPSMQAQADAYNTQYGMGG